MKLNVLFSAFQDHQILETGKNSSSKNECLELLWDYAMSDSDEEEEFLYSLTDNQKESHLNSLGFTIEQTY